MSDEKRKGCILGGLIAIGVTVSFWGLVFWLIHICTT